MYFLCLKTLVTSYFAGYGVHHSQRRVFLIQLFYWKLDFFLQTDSDDWKKAEYRIRWLVNPYYKCCKTYPKGIHVYVHLISDIKTFTPLLFVCTTFGSHPSLTFVFQWCWSGGFVVCTIFSGCVQQALSCLWPRRLWATLCCTDAIATTTKAVKNLEIIA